MLNHIAFLYNFFPGSDYNNHKMLLAAAFGQGPVLQVIEVHEVGIYLVTTSLAYYISSNHIKNIFALTMGEVTAKNIF